MSFESGRVAFEGEVASSIFGSKRFIRVYVPRSYDRDRGRVFPVLYLQDGQNAFSTVGEHVAFGWGNWQLDRTVDQLTGTDQMQEIIMVAVDCGSSRYLEYRGPTARDNRRYQEYRRFLIEELKPRIDAEFRTAPQARLTGVMGSSMGGICSLALAWQHPSVFGLAASISGAFQVERHYFLNYVLRAYRGRPKRIRIYLDSGVVDGSGSDDGCALTAAVGKELGRIGWREEINLRRFVDQAPLGPEELERTGLRPDKWTEAQTSQHNEFYWRLRAWRALTFLFPPSEPPA